MARKQRNNSPMAERANWLTGYNKRLPSPEWEGKRAEVFRKTLDILKGAGLSDETKQG